MLYSFSPLISKINSMTIAERLVKIKEKFELLKSKDKDLKIFGAGDDLFFNVIGHHYEWRPVLTEEQIQATEKKIGVRLPEEYREFLKVLGNGGPGPEWGIFELDNTYPSDDFLEKYPNMISMDCDYADEYAIGIKTHHLDKDPTYMEPVEPFGGYIKLADYGHGMCAYMVVGGDQQVGKIWFMFEDGDVMKIAPAVKRVYGTSSTPAMQKVEGRDWQVTFLDWFENWLDDSLAQV